MKLWNATVRESAAAPAMKAGTLLQGSARQRPAGMKRTASEIDGSTLVRGNAERFEVPPLHYVASWRHAQTRIRAKDKYEDAVLAYQISVSAQHLHARQPSPIHRIIVHHTRGRQQGNA